MYYSHPLSKTEIMYQEFCNKKYCILSTILDSTMKLKNVLFTVIWQVAYIL